MNKQTQAALAKIHPDKRVRHLVDDPNYEGEGPAPKIGRSEAMRKLRAEGASITQIAEFYDVSYQTAYLAVRDHGVSAVRNEPSHEVPSPEELSTKSKATLLKMASTKVKEGEPGWERAQAAADELDRRFPGWV